MGLRCVCGDIECGGVYGEEPCGYCILEENRLFAEDAVREAGGPGAGLVEMIRERGPADALHHWMQVADGIEKAGYASAADVMRALKEYMYATRETLATVRALAHAMDAAEGIRAHHEGLAGIDVYVALCSTSRASA